MHWAAILLLLLLGQDFILLQFDEQNNADYLHILNLFNDMFSLLVFWKNESKTSITLFQFGHFAYNKREKWIYTDNVQILHTVIS